MQAITLHTAGESPLFDRLSQSLIVSRLQPNGRFVDTYVADLVTGDKFFVPVHELPPRSGDHILAWIGEHRIQWEFERGYPHLDKEEQHKVILTSESQPRFKFEHSYSDDDHGGALRSALEFVLDQYEL